jgi:L-fuculose-phosphate aldolase
VSEPPGKDAHVDDASADAGATSDTAGTVRAELVAYGRKLLQLGLLSQTSGNLSVKTADGSIYITPSSMEYNLIEEADIVVVGPDGSRRQGHRAPSSETPLHCLVYQSRPEVSAIVHTHSPHATTLAVLGMTIPAVHYNIAMLGTTEIQVARYATYGTQQLANNVRDAFPPPARAVLLANHGMLAVGGTLKKAADGAEMVETLAGLYYRALAIGQPNILSEEQMAEVMAKYGKKVPV